MSGRLDKIAFPKDDDFEPKGRKCGDLRPKGPAHVKCRLPRDHPGEHWYYENMCCGVPIYQSTWPKRQALVS